MAWQDIEDDKCPGCGNPLSETTLFEKRTEWQVEKLTCHGCKARSAKSESTGDGEFAVVIARDHG